MFSRGTWRQAIEPLEPRRLRTNLPVHQPLDALVDLTPLIVAGDPNGDPADSPADRVDANHSDSVFAGVGSVYMQPAGGGGFIGSAAAIGPRHVLTAGHNVDLDNDGVIDLDADGLTFFLNAGGDLSHRIKASAIHLHPDYTGFNAPAVNDDIAVIELREDLPASVPIYPLHNGTFASATTVLMVGYGTSGNGVDGYTANPKFHVKRVGYQRADAYELDDENTGRREVFQFDFDGGGHNLFGGSSLGNDLEATIGPGDSGGPSFVDDGEGNLSIFGVNTFGFGGEQDAPLFGSGGGGMVVAAYLDWIRPLLGDETSEPTPPAQPEPADAAPVAEADAAVTDASGRAQIALLANDRDPEGRPLVIARVTSPSHGHVHLDVAGDPFRPDRLTRAAGGSVVVNADGVLTYQADDGFRGVDSFAYAVSDGHGVSELVTVVVTVVGPTASLATATPHASLFSAMPIAQADEPAGLFDDERREV